MAQIDGEQVRSRGWFGIIRDTAVILAAFGAIFWVGQYSQQLKQVDDEFKKVNEQFNQVNNRLIKVESSLTDSKKILDYYTDQAIEKVKNQGQIEYNNITTAKPRTEPGSLVVPPVWLQERQVIKALQDQILIHTPTIDAINRYAVFELHIPGAEHIKWNFFRAAERRTFKYKEETYLFDILDIRMGDKSPYVKEVQISIVKQIETLRINKYLCAKYIQSD